jgi:hypothetical protein
MTGNQLFLHSLENQFTAIQTYADSHGFVVPTYSDAAKSGLVLRRRIGLRPRHLSSHNHQYFPVALFGVTKKPAEPG